MGSLKSKKQLAVLLSMTLTVLSMAQTAYAGHGVGNGGDHVRASFMLMGDAINTYLQETEEGRKLLNLNGLQINDLQATLDINVIDVQDGVLIDNRGSVVDAIGIPGKITLSKDRWINHLENNRDVYFLVFHEMLRAIGVNDDNYIISKSVSPFPATRKIVTRVASIYPLLGEIPLSSMINIDKIQLEGDGCPRQLAGTFANFDLEKNILNVAFQRYDLNLTISSSDRKSCTIAIPVNPPVGKKLTVTQVDFSAKGILSAKTNASISSDATYGSSLIAPFSKTFVAANNTQGRLLARSQLAVSSNCKGSGELLKIRTATSLLRVTGGIATVNRLIADGINISFIVENCSK